MLTEMRGISADFSGCEIIVAAGLSGDRGLYEAETSPYCHRCLVDDLPGAPCSCPDKADGERGSHTGLHWLAAHLTFGSGAVKENRYQAKACVPKANTEILTRRGWLSWDQVHEGDETVGYDISTGTSRWTKILAVVENDRACTERLTVGNNFSVVATPDHRWATVKRRDSGKGRYFEPRMEKQEDIGCEHVITLSASGASGDGLPVTDAEAAVIGWVYTDGHIVQSPLTGRTSQGSDGRRRGLQVGVVQAKPEGIVSLERDLAGLPYSRYERSTEGNLTPFEYRLPAEYSRDLWKRAGIYDVADKSAPGFSLEQFVLRMSASQRESFLRACVDAEGSRDKHGTIRFPQNEGPVLEAVALAAYLEGYYVKRYGGKQDARGNALHWLLTFTRSRVGTTRMKREDAGVQDTWCVQTETGTWTMRQDGGPAMITGNTIFRKLFGGAPDSAVAEKIANVFDYQIAPVYKQWDDWLRKCYEAGSLVYRDYSGHGENYSVDLPGRRRYAVYRTYSGRQIYAGKGAHATGNYAIQGTARELLVDGINLWGHSKWGHLPILPVHDQVICFVPREEASEATRVLAECMATDVLSTDDWNVHIDADPDTPFFSWPDSSLRANIACMNIQFPHCDYRILHAPGECRYCDRRPEWQELRNSWGIAFSGHAPEHGQTACPADTAVLFGERGDYNQWGGNIPKPDNS